MGDKLIMSKKERTRKGIFEMIKAGQITQVDAAIKLSLCTRQVSRAFQRYLTQGDAGLIHQSRGKRSPNAFPQLFKDNVLKLYFQQYHGLDLA